MKKKSIVSKDEQEKLLQWPNFQQSTINEVALELAKGEDALYLHAKEFELKWNKYLNCKYSLSSNSGTASIHSALYGLNLDEDSEVLVPTYTYWASIVPMRYYNLVPVFCDVDRNTGILDLEDAQNRITNKTKAILIVHLWGMSANMDEVVRFAKDNGLKIIEDVAHAHGSTWNGKKLGTFGDVSIFSFQASKLMPTIEGGMLCTNDKSIYERALSLGHYLHIKSLPKNHNLEHLKDACLGNKFRINPISALIGKLELPFLDKNNESFSQAIKGFHQKIENINGISIPKSNILNNRVYYANFIHIDFKKIKMNREELINKLNNKGCIFGRTQYPLQHTLEVYRKDSYWKKTPVIKGKYLGAKELKDKEFSFPRFSLNSYELMESYVSILMKVLK